MTIGLNDDGFEAHETQDKGRLEVMMIILLVTGIDFTPKMYEKWDTQSDFILSKALQRNQLQSCFAADLQKHNSQGRKPAKIESITWPVISKR